MLLSQTTKACVVKYDFHPTVSGSHIAVILEGIFAGQTPSLDLSVSFFLSKILSSLHQLQRITKQKTEPKNRQSSPILSKIHYF